MRWNKHNLRMLWSAGFPPGLVKRLFTQYILGFHKAEADQEGWFQHKHFSMLIYIKKHKLKGLAKSESMVYHRLSKCGRCTYIGCCVVFAPNWMFADPYNVAVIKWRRCGTAEVLGFHKVQSLESDSVQRVLCICCVIVVSVKARETKAIICNLLLWTKHMICRDGHARVGFSAEMLRNVSCLHCLHSLLQCNRTSLVVEFKTWHSGLAKRNAGFSKHQLSTTGRNLAPKSRAKTSASFWLWVGWLGSASIREPWIALRKGLSQNQHAQPQLTWQSCDNMLKTCHTSTMCWGKISW